jgi:ubiquinone/menaquinone biosynthesis C-methylase UbiE
MNTQQAYNHWAEQYDSNANKTRDLEAVALRAMLAQRTFRCGLEIGCGTGKNTIFLQSICETLTAVDFSSKMLVKAKAKVDSPHVTFRQADITEQWSFAKDRYDLITFSLVLEHIEHLDPVFAKVREVADVGSIIYVGELHPFKQYGGSKAKFETPEGTQVVPCFTHHVSEFISAAKANGLIVRALDEYFDDNVKNGIPRVLTILFERVE